MKTKMKTIMSVCMLTVLLYACTKDSNTPEPVYDCMRVENGIAAMDDCGDCHQSYMYQGMGVVTLIETYRDTVGLDGMLILAGSAEDIANNPSWNTGCK